jgi:DNA-binding beta-propeller fold protein YncE
MCASCAAGATLISATSGCTPSATLTAGPADTAFYLSGSSSEGVAAFSSVAAPEGVSNVAGPFGAASGALAMAGGSYLSVPGVRAPAALPSGGNVTFSASAWVKCAAPATWAAVLEWGAAGDAQQGASPQALALNVGTVPLPNSAIVTTLAGSGNPGYADGTGTAASFAEPLGVAIISSSGVIVVAEYGNNRIRLLTPHGVVTTLAGGGGGFLADGIGTAASFKQPYGVAVIPSNGMIVVVDSGNTRIRLVTYPNGVVTTIAGNCDRGRNYYGDCIGGSNDGTGAVASFNYPQGVAVIPSSSAIVVADSNNNVIRLVSYPGGVVTTLAGNGLYQLTDGPSVLASFRHPSGVAVIPSSGVIVVADGNNAIRLVTPLGDVTTLAGNCDDFSRYYNRCTGSFADGISAAASFNNPYGIAVIPSTGVIVVADSDNGRVRLVTSLGVVTTLADGFGPYGLAVSSLGSVFVTADRYNNLIRRIELPVILPACDSTWHHVALTYSPSASPYKLSAFLDGALAFASAATITLPAASVSTLRIGWSGDLSSNAGSLYSGALAELRIYNRSLSAAEVLALAQPPLAAFPNTAAFPNSYSILAGATTYAVSCAAGFAGGAYGVPSVLMKGLADGTWAWQGCVTAAPACAACAPGAYSFGGSACVSCAAGAALTSTAEGCAPVAALTAGPADTAFFFSGSAAEGVAAFPSVAASTGVSYVAGPFGAAGGALMLARGSYLMLPGASAPAALPSGGSVAWSASAWVKCAAPPTWVAALEWGAAGGAQQLASPQALALDVGASPLPNSGVVATLAGSGSAAFADGTGTSASFSYPSGVAVIPSSGVIVVADKNNHLIRLVTPLGIVTTLAGSGSAAFADGAGAAASFFSPAGVAVVPSNGMIVVADQLNHRIRLVTYPGGVVTTLAGSGSAAFADGAGAAASFFSPAGVAVVPSNGMIVVADQLNHRIRLATYPGGVVTTLAGGSGGFADGTGTAARFNSPQGVAVILSAACSSWPMVTTAASVL